jgi:hypothetical protein
MNEDKMSSGKDIPWQASAGITPHKFSFLKIFHFQILGVFDQHRKKVK